MIKTGSDINTILSKLDLYDSEGIRRVLMLIERSNSISIAAIQHELKTGYMKAAKLLDLFIKAEILKKINKPLPEDSSNKNCYELLIPKSNLTELISILHFEEQLKEYANDMNLTQTLQALAFIRQNHTWQKQKQEGYFNISPLAMACNAVDNMGIQDDDAITAILLQDMIKYYGVSPEDLPVTDNIRKSINLITFRVTSEETEKTAKKCYYDKLLENREATLARLIDKLHNFPKDNTAQYVENATKHTKEVQEYIIPLIYKAKEMYPTDSKAFSYLENHIKSVSDSMDLKVQILKRGFDEH